jgi:hypothetical protein
VDTVMAVLQAEGFERAAVFGQLQQGPARLRVV